MIGYKAFDKNLCCRGFQYEVGKTYTKDTKKEDLECCTDKVFHFCREIYAIEEESDYMLSESRICEVIAGDYVKSGDKYGTNSITILRELTSDEKEDLLNSGRLNTGYHNSGLRNSGNCNSGNYNSGFRNSGNYNIGSWNSGNRNIGSHNTGHYNIGCYNAGGWNKGDRNSGYFNTDEPPVRIFNKETNLKRWEIQFPDFLYFGLDPVTNKHKTEEGTESCEGCERSEYLLEYKKAFRQAWDKASKEEHKQLLKLPNWDNGIFKEISGIDAEEEIRKENEIMEVVE